MKYVRNSWYVAGWSREFDRSLTRVTILERDIVVYRTEAGVAVALEDRCPHKMLKSIGDISIACKKA